MATREELAAIARAGLEAEDQVPPPEIRNGWVVLQIKELMEPFTPFEQERGDPYEVRNSEGEPAYYALTFGHGFAWGLAEATEIWSRLEPAARKSTIVIDPRVPIPVLYSGEMMLSHLVARNLGWLNHMFAKVAGGEAPICLVPLPEDGWEDDPGWETEGLADEDQDEHPTPDAKSLEDRLAFLDFGRFIVPTPNGLKYWNIWDEDAPSSYKQIEELNESAAGGHIRNAVARDFLGLATPNELVDGDRAGNASPFMRRSERAPGKPQVSFVGPRVRKVKDSRPTASRRVTRSHEQWSDFTAVVRAVLPENQSALKLASIDFIEKRFLLGQITRRQRALQLSFVRRQLSLGMLEKIEREIEKQKR